MVQENARDENVSQQFKGREISPLEYEIPFTDYDWSFYLDVLWPDLREEYQSKNIVKEEIIQLVESREGRVLDLGPGASNFIPSLNEFLIKDGTSPKGIRIDLQYSKEAKIPKPSYCFIINPDDLNGLTESDKRRYIEQRDKSRAIAGDALTLPVKNDAVQLIVSNELLPYFLEKGESYEKFIKFRQKNFEVVEREYQYRKFCGPKPVIDEKDFQIWQNRGKELAAKYLEAIKDMESYEKELAPYFFSQPQYDLELLSMFFKEGNRILKNNLKPKAEMRVYPFTFFWLLKLVRGNDMTFKDWQEQERDYNIARIEKFLKIIRENFSQVQFYGYDPDITLLGQLRIKIEQTLFKSLLELLNKYLPREILAQFSQVVLKNPLSLQRGVLILQK